MKFFTKKGIVNKLILVLLVLIVFNAIIPTNQVCAASDESMGGALLKPIADLLLALGDGVLNVIHKVFYGMSEAALKISLNRTILEWMITIAVGVAVAILVAVVATFVLSTVVPAILGGIATAVAGASTAIATGISTAAANFTAAAAGTVVVVSVTSGVAAGAYVNSNWYGDEAVLPLYQISAEEIFQGDVPILDVNFFSNENRKITRTSIEEAERVDSYGGIYTGDDIFDEVLQRWGYTDRIIVDVTANNQVVAAWEHEDTPYIAKLTMTFFSDPTQNGGYPYYANLAIYKGEYKLHTVDNIGYTLKGTIASWYYNLRTFAIVIMVLVLMYIGIRIILSSTAAEKSKYKNMLKDWVVAFCLLFVMHYIMAFAMNLNDKIIDVVKSANNDEYYTVTIYDANGKIEQTLREHQAEYYSEIDLDSIIVRENNKTGIIWNCGNLMGLIRNFAAQNATGSLSYVGYVMAFLVLVWYTIFFLFSYMKRVIYLAFLTIMAPLVAMTYPIDKVNDGKAQAFDMWLKEYIFNLLIQPMHLILYTLLVSSAFELASTNIIYSLVAIGFLMPAEKLMRKFFGFEKAQTPGMLGGAIGASLMMNGLNRVLHGKPPRKGGGNGDNGSGVAKTKDDDYDSFTETSIYDSETMMGKDFKDIPGRDLKEKPNKDNIDNMPIIDTKTPTEVVQNDIDRKFRDRLEGKNNPSETKYPMIQRPSTENIPKRRPLTDAEKEKIKQAQLKKTFGKNYKPKKTVGYYTSKAGNKLNQLKTSSLEYAAKKSNQLKAASQEYARQKLYQAAVNNANGKWLKDASRVAAGAVVGAGTGILGATFGIAGGDPMKTAQYGGGAAAAGFALGSRETSPSVNQKAIQREYEKAQYDTIEEYRKAKMEEETRRQQQDAANIRKLQEKLGLESAEEAKRILEESSYFFNAGRTDMSELATIYKLTHEEGWSEAKAMTTAKYLASAGTRPSKMGKKEYENIEFKFRNEAKKKTSDEQQIRQYVDNMIQSVERFGSIKDNLNEVKK